MVAEEDEVAELKRRLAELEAAPKAAPPPPLNAKKNGCLTAVVLVGGFIAIVAAIGSAGDNDTSSSGDLLSITGLSATGAELAKDPTDGWIYNSDVDKMTDKTTRTACVVSVNQVRLDWPYKAVNAQLCLRNSPQFGRDAYVSLMGDGQVMCRSYDGCTVKVRFDDGAQQDFSASSSSDGSSNVFFIDNRARLETGLKSASRTLVQAEFYQAGVQSMEFNTAGLKWPDTPK